MERITMTVSMQVTIPQALTLQAMFEYWNSLASMGGSRKVAFYVDGDGNFHPKCQFIFSKPLPLLNDDLKRRAVVEDKGGDRLYDFDPIAWRLREEKDELERTK